MTSSAITTGTEPSDVLDVTRVLLPLSGAEKDERAVPVAVAAARRLQAPLVLMSAVSDDILVARLEGYLGRIDEGIADVATSIEVVQGPNPLKAVAALCGPETLPVMATSGRLLIHDTYLGSAGAWVVRESHRPVVLVGPDCDVDAALDIDRVIVPVDGSQLGDRAAPVGVAWAERLGVPLWFVTVLPEVEPAKVVEAVGSDLAVAESNHIRSLARELGRRHDDLDLEWEVLHGRDAATAITSFAGPRGLVCMGSHGRTGLSAIAMGSVARKVVRHAAQPVVVWCCPEIGNQG